jgi:hypothetical protein
MGSGLQNFDYSLLLLYIPNFNYVLLSQKKRRQATFSLNKKRGQATFSIRNGAVSTRRQSFGGLTPKN